MFSVDVVTFINLFFLDCPFDVLSKKSLPNPRSHRFSRSFIVSDNIFRSLIHFELLFAVQETQVLSLSQEDPRRREWPPNPIFLPGESPWTEEPGDLHSMGSQGVRHNWAINTFCIVGGMNPGSFLWV